MGMFKSPRSAGSLSTRTRWLALAAMAVVMVVVIGVLVSACGGTLGSTDTTAGQGTATTASAAPGSTATTVPSASSGTTTPTVKAQGEASPAVDVAKILGPSVVNLKVQFASAGGNFGFGQQQQPDQQYSIRRFGRHLPVRWHDHHEQPHGLRSEHWRRAHGHQGHARHRRSTRRDPGGPRSADRDSGHQGQHQQGVAGCQVRRATADGRRVCRRHR